MATYTTTEWKQGAHKAPEAGIVMRRIAYTLTAALAQGTSDVLKVCKIPKGATLVPPLCAFWSSNDPDSANNATAKLDLTDGTVTKNLVASGNLFAADTALSGTFDIWAANDFFKTPSKDYYIAFTPTANDVDSGAQLKFCVTYLCDGDTGDQIT